MYVIIPLHILYVIKPRHIIYVIIPFHIIYVILLVPTDMTSATKQTVCFFVRVMGGWGWGNVRNHLLFTSLGVMLVYTKTLRHIYERTGLHRHLGYAVANV